MAKKVATVELLNYGLYNRWDDNSKAIPKIIDITTQITILPGIEFGYILRIKGIKGKLIHYRIDHPIMKDASGDVMPPFEGTYFIRSNNADFFLGDTVWEPYEQMAGAWELTTWYENKILAHKKFQLHYNETTF